MKRIKSDESVAHCWIGNNILTDPLRYDFSDDIMNEAFHDHITFFCEDLSIFTPR